MKVDLAKYADYPTAKLEQLLSQLSDKSEADLVLNELKNRYQAHYSELLGDSESPSPGADSSSKSEAIHESKISETENTRKSKESRYKPQDTSDDLNIEKQPEQQSITQAVGQGLQYCLTLLLAAVLPIWIIRILIHPILTLSKLLRLVVAILAIPIILIISIILAPLKLVLLLITFGKVNLFKKLFISKFKDLYNWVAPNGFWKD